MRIKLLFILMIVFAGLSAQTSVNLQGTVSDKYSGSAISGAIVTLVGRGQQDTTDGQGRFEIRQVTTGMERFLASSGAISPRFWPGRGIVFRNPSPGAVGI